MAILTIGEGCLDAAAVRAAASIAAEVAALGDRGHAATRKRPSAPAEPTEAAQPSGEGRRRKRGSGAAAQGEEVGMHPHVGASGTVEKMDVAALLEQVKREKALKEKALKEKREKQVNREANREAKQEKQEKRVKREEQVKREKALKEERVKREKALKEEREEREKRAIEQAATEQKDGGRLEEETRDALYGFNGATKALRAKALMLLSRDRTACSIAATARQRSHVLGAPHLAALDSPPSPSLVVAQGL